MKSPLGTSVTLLVNVPTAAADAANLPADKRTAGSVVQLRSDDAAELVAAGLAAFAGGTPDTGTIGAHRLTIDDVVASPKLRAAFGSADPVLAGFSYDAATGNLLSYTEDGITITLTYNADGTVATSRRGTNPAKVYTYTGGNLTGVA